MNSRRVHSIEGAPSGFHCAQLNRQHPSEYSRLALFTRRPAHSPKTYLCLDEGSWHSPSTGVKIAQPTAHSSFPPSIGESFPAASRAIGPWKSILAGPQRHPKPSKAWIWDSRTSVCVTFGEFHEDIHLRGRCPNPPLSSLDVISVTAQLYERAPR
jgi:hypothetical protein